MLKRQVTVFLKMSGKILDLVINESAYNCYVFKVEKMIVN